LFNLITYILKKKKLQRSMQSLEQILKAGSVAEWLLFDTFTVYSIQIIYCKSSK